MEHALSGAEELSKQTEIRFGLVQKGATEAFFKVY